MTSTLDTEARRQRRRRIAATLAAPALILLCPVVALLRSQEYGALNPESLLLLTGAVTVGVAVGALALIRPRTLEPALITMLVVMVLMTRPARFEPLILGWPLNRLLDSVGIVPAVSLLFIVLLILLACLCRLLGRHLSVIAAAVFGTIALSTALGSVPSSVENENGVTSC